ARDVDQAFLPVVATLSPRSSCFCAPHAAATMFALTWMSHTLEAVRMAPVRRRARPTQTELGRSALRHQHSIVLRLCHQVSLYLDAARNLRDLSRDRCFRVSAGIRFLEALR